jgi:hypothetical protein
MSASPDIGCRKWLTFDSGASRMRQAGGMLNTEKPQIQVAHDVPAFLADLERGGALSSFQARRLLAAWPPLADDWAANPYFGTVREHTRAYIDQLASVAVGGV